MNSVPRIFAALFLVLSLVLGTAQIAHAQTHVYVKNDTAYPLQIHRPETSGAKVNSKAWKHGVDKIAAGGRERVLTLIRKGKVNWMDPTPRFIEPGKEVVFSTTVSRDDATATQIVLLQKLLGTGKTTKLSYSVAKHDAQPQWHIDQTSHRISLPATKTEQWAIDFRSFRDSGKTHVEYTFSPAK